MLALTQSPGGPANGVLAKNGADDWGELSRGERCLVPPYGGGLLFHDHARHDSPFSC